MAILFMGREPIAFDDFLFNFKMKYSQWTDFKVIRTKTLAGPRSSKLETTWKMNCKTLNFAIGDNARGRVMKYVIAAPTGSAKTENLITYCSMLPKDITALISTNLTDEADKIAEKINDEARDSRAVSYHSKKSKEEILEIEEVAKYQVIVTTHAFYKNHYTGGEKWQKLGEDRDLLVIDEALETMRELSVRDDSIRRAITIFEYMQKSNLLKGDLKFAKEIQLLRDELQVLANYSGGTNLITDENTNVLRCKFTPLKSMEKYPLFLKFFVKAQAKTIKIDPKFKKYFNTLNFNHIISGIKDSSANDILKKELIETIVNLNIMSKLGQVYITSNQGHNSFHRVTDMMFTKSLVCFDATATANKVYELRSKYYNDIHMVAPTEGVRNYSNVTIHTTAGRTGKKSIDKDLVANILQSVTLGNKTLIITHNQHKSLFVQEATQNYSDKTVEVAHWNAITGLNDWQNFDTCIIVGLNHKPKSYAQNRTIINTDSEETAFGEEQDILNNSIENSAILAEIIQAMNRIRIRKIINLDGNCEPADIYIILPNDQKTVYEKQIAGHMPNIQFKDWVLKSAKHTGLATANFDILIQYLESNLKRGDTIEKKNIVKVVGIKPESFRTMMGKNSFQQQKFRENLHKCGFEIKEIIGKGRKTATQYFYKI
ncbi:DEAD/DEAH box helicase family protein [Sulfurovum sp. CS9]|uniref:DEAD/DEAH box helicase family protein n=1 Tax=Sulfurovum sp. CS9 TaxID=3391146 RepID=UPI0039E97266